MSRIFGAARDENHATHQMSGIAGLDQKNKRIMQVVLNKAAPLAGLFVKALGDSLLQEQVLLNLREI
jgi:hypothetical protein